MDGFALYIAVLQRFQTNHPGDGAYGGFYVLRRREGDSKGLIKQKFCIRFFMPSPFVKRILLSLLTHLHIGTFARSLMTQHAKASVTVTGDSNLYKLRCIRARVEVESGVVYPQC